MKAKNHIIVIALLLLFIIGVHAQTDTTQHVISERRNSDVQKQKPYVILISADGFRHDYVEKHHAKHLAALAAKGVRAASLVPSFPSLTFPNHYSIVTGLYPSHHGLVNNTFYDPVKQSNYAMGNAAAVQDGSWYGGTPLWVLAEQQQMISASMFWVGSEADVKGIRPTYYYNYHDKFPVSSRIETIRQWLLLPEDRRPHIITFYMSEPDHTSHTFGPDAPETGQVVKSVDSAIHALTEAVKTTGLPVNFIFLADHGMTAVDREHPIRTPSVINREKLIIPASGTMMVLHAKDPADIQPVYDSLKRYESGYKAYLKKDMPGKYHFNPSDDRMNRIGDILLIPDWPRVFSDRKPGAGYHGYPATDVKDMHATFIAWGPAFKQGITIPSFENVHIYPLVADILGLSYTEAIDGRKEVLQDILK